jgi:glycosyltransferase involved in cell wall biosynthesis
MKVSVVVPAFNQADYLREALASALAQTHADLEVIVVDDGSTDHTRAVCESVHDPRLRYVYQTNDRTFGLGARNQAMLLAQGEWIALLDQDDRWAPDKLEKQLRRAGEQPEAGAVFCRVRFIDGAGQVTGEQATELPEGDVFHALLVRNRYHAVSGIFKRALLPAIGLPHAWVGLGDHALWLAVARRAPVAVVDELLADYRVHAQGYQEAQRRAGLMRFAHDGWQLTMTQAPLLHFGCATCRAAHARSRRGAAKSYWRALRAQWRGGQWAGSGAALRRACTAAPLWLLQPWVLLPQAIMALVASIKGLLRPVR